MSRLLENRVLIIGEENSGVRDVSRCLVENKLKTTYQLDILMHNTLPLPGNRGLQQTEIKFVCFVVNSASTESLSVVTKSLLLVDTAFFAGRCVLVANRRGNPEDSVIPPETLSQLAEKYAIPLYHTNTQVEDHLKYLGCTLMSHIAMAIGWKRHISPLFYETVKLDSFSSLQNTSEAFPTNPCTDTPIQET